MKELNLWNSACKETEVLSFSLSLNAKLFSNVNKTPRERQHVWIASVCGDGTCALNLYQDLLWTVWYSQRECGLNFSGVSVERPRTMTSSIRGH